MPPRLARATALLATLALAAACGGPTATPTPESSSPASPEVTASANTGPTDSPGATDTGTVPTDTPTAGPTDTPSAPPTPAPTPFPIAGSLWFGPLPPLPAGSTLPFNDGSVDYFDLWKSGAAWPNAESRTGVFKVYSSWVMNYASSNQLAKVVNGVAAAHIQLALEIGAFDANGVGCGQGVEGFDGTLDALKKIRNAGGHVDIVSFDEPYAFGVRDTGANACHWSVGQAAYAAVTFVNQLRKFDSHMLIGDTEPMWAGISADDIGGWLDAYAQATGRPMDFLQLDADWSQADWATTFKSVEAAARSRGVPVAPIYNGGDATSDADWTNLAMERAFEYEQVVGGKPDFVTLQSWMDKPDHVLPETDPTTFTGLIDRYLSPRSNLTITSFAAAGSGAVNVTGRLQNTAGGAIANAKVNALLTPLNGVRQTLTLDGTVPDGATAAVAGIRVNMEGAGPGSANMRVYGFNYAENGSATNLVPNSRFVDGLANWGVEGNGSVTVAPSDEGNGSMLKLLATPDQTILLNSAAMTASAGATYHFEVSVKVPAASAASAYATIIFLAGSEIRRDIVALAPVAIDAGSAKTDGNGGLSFNLTGLQSGSYTLRLDYPGDLTHWPAWVERAITVQ
jgi:hypothetical protein